jgi:hypothetical protein
MTKKIALPYFVYWIAELWTLLTATFWACWLENDRVWVHDSPTVRAIFQMVSFFPAGPSEMEKLVAVIACLAVEFLVIGAVAFQAIYFYHHRKFWSVTLYPTRFLLEICPLVINGPLGCSTGLVWATVAGPSPATQYYFLAVILPLAWAFNAIVFYVSSELLNNAAYIAHNPFASFLQSKHTLMFLEFGILAAMDVFFNVFPRWMRLFLIGIHFFSSLYYLTLSWDLPFLFETPSIIFMSFLPAFAVCDVLGFILYLTDMELDVHVVIGVAGGSLLISVCVLWFVVHNRIAAVRRQLAYNNETSLVDMGELSDACLSETEKEERFDVIGLTSQGRVFLFLLVGFRNASDLFLDFSLLKHCVLVCPTPEVLRLALRLLIFFPSEYRQSNLLLRDLKHNRDLDMGTVFLMTQIEKIRVVRQSSASAHGAVKLKEMKLIVSETESLITGMWGLPEVGYSAFRDLDEKVDSANAHCQETVAEFPNSIQHVEEYVHFLVECATDFSSAVRQRQRIELMESGHSFAIDYSYRSMVRAFPLYVKKKILDIKGAFVRTSKTGAAASQASQNTASNSSSDNSASSLTTGGSGSNSIELDAALEETLARALLTQPKTRLALQHALVDKHANVSRPFTIYIVFQCVVSIAVAATLFGIGHTYFEDRPAITARGDSIDEFRLAMISSGLVLLLKWGNVTGRLNMSFLDSVEAGEPLLPNYIPRVGNHTIQSMDFLVRSLSEFKLFSAALIELAEKGESRAYHAFPTYFQAELEYVMCSSSKQLPPEIYNIKNIFLHYYLVAAMLIGNPTVSTWYTANNDFCTFFASLSKIMPVFTSARRGDVEDAVRSYESDDTFLRLLRTIVPSVYAAVAFLPYPLFIFFIVREMRQVCSFIAATDTQFKQEAMKSLRRSTNDQPDPQVNSHHSKVDSKEILMLIFVFALFGGSALVSVLTLSQAISTNDRFRDIIAWADLQGIQRSQLVGMLTHMFNRGYLTNATLDHLTNATSGADLVIRIGQLGQEVLDHMADLIKGNTAVRSILDVDIAIDDLLLKEDCESAQALSPDDFHTM